jgi:WD40 repeat protein
VLFDVDSGREVARLKGDTDWMHCLTFSPDGRTLLTGHGERYFGVGWIKVWDAATGEERSTLWGHRDMVTDLRFTPNGKRLVSASGSGVKFWDLTIGQEVLTLPGGSGLRLTRDARTLAVGPAPGNGSRVRLWHAASEEEVRARDPRPDAEEK